MLPATLKNLLLIAALAPLVLPGMAWSSLPDPAALAGFEQTAGDAFDADEIEGGAVASSSACVRCERAAVPELDARPFWRPTRTALPRAPPATRA